MQSKTTPQSELSPTEEARLEAQELALLLGEGRSFTISHRVRQRVQGWRGWLLRQKEWATRSETFTIAEPTLSTLDRLSREWLALTYDEASLSSGGDEMWGEAKRLAHQHPQRLARIVAIATLGGEYTEREAQRLTALFFETVKPSELITIAQWLTSVCNLGDFIASIRLMSASRTSKPTRADRVE